MQGPALPWRHGSHNIHLQAVGGDGGAAAVSPSMPFQGKHVPPVGKRGGGGGVET